MASQVGQRIHSPSGMSERRPSISCQVLGRADLGAGASTGSWASAGLGLPWVGGLPPGLAGLGFWLMPGSFVAVAVTPFEADDGAGRLAGCLAKQWGLAGNRILLACYRSV